MEWYLEEAMPVLRSIVEMYPGNISLHTFNVIKRIFYIKQGFPCPANVSNVSNISNISILHIETILISYILFVLLVNTCTDGAATQGRSASDNLTLCCASVTEFVGVFVNYTSCQPNVACLCARTGLSIYFRGQPMHDFKMT
ncbi:hypothetical protein GQR58_014515 [Nymphon striatum]|nr:hypothetical protein GQR58_014515 [Nymphon striatum]